MRAAHPHVLYVLWQFPVPSEQFILRELKAVAGTGTRVDVLVMGPARALQPGLVDELVPELSVSRIRPVSVRRSVVRTLRHPVRMARATRAALSLARGGDRGSWRRAIAMLSLIPAALGEALSTRPTSLHAHFGSLPAAFTLILAAALRSPWGFSVHARDLYAEPFDLVPKARSAVYVAACSRAAARDLEGLLREDAHKVSCVHHGLDEQEWLRAARGGAREEAPLRLLAVGRFEPKKGLDVLVRACAQLVDREVDFECLIVGEGPEEPALRRLIRELDLAERVTLAPWSSPEELRARYSAASALVVPSVVAPDGDRDNIPNVVLEALAMELPVVASALPAIREALDGGRVGWLAEPGDVAGLAEVVARLAAGREAARSRSLEGRHWFEENFTSRRSAAGMSRLFRLAAGAQPEATER